MILKLHPRAESRFDLPYLLPSYQFLCGIKNNSTHSNRPPDNAAARLCFRHDCVTPHHHQKSISISDCGLSSYFPTHLRQWLGLLDGIGSRAKHCSTEITKFSRTNHHPHHPVPPTLASNKVGSRCVRIVI